MILKTGQYGAAFESQVQAATASTPPPASNKPLLGKLRVTSGANAGKELGLSKALTTIGKPGVQVAAVPRRADGSYIVHVGGETGPRRAPVNRTERRTHARQRAPGDRIDPLAPPMTLVHSPPPASATR